METNNLKEKTLIVNRVEYKGKFFKAFIITNQTAATLNKDLQILKVIAVSDAYLSQTTIIDALFDFFSPKKAKDISDSIEKLLSETNDVDYVVDVIRNINADSTRDQIFYSAVQKLTVHDIHTC